MTEFVVRRATSNEEDVALVAPLFDAYRQVYGQPPDERLATEFIRDRLRTGESVIFLALSGSRAVKEALGFVQLYPLFSSLAARRIWVLNDLFVSPLARRSGVGRSLMEAARRHAVDSGAKKLVLKTEAENRRAQALYESLGYACENDAIRFYALAFE
jgi:ribosomal protein S18 acetylase RimI-like enzyme